MILQFFVFLVGETMAQRNEILGRKAPGKASGDCRESPGDHLLLFSVIRSQVGSLSRTGTPTHLGWGRHRFLGFISNLRGFGYAQVYFAPFKNQ